MLIVTLFILKISWFCMYLDIYVLCITSYHSYWDKIVYLWASYHLFLKPLTSSLLQTFGVIHIHVKDQTWYRWHRSHNDDTDTVINTDDLNYIIGNDKPNYLHLQICFPIWNMIISVKRSLWILHGLIVWGLFYCWHTVTVMRITSWCPLKSTVMRGPYTWVSKGLVKTLKLYTFHRL